ncbi:helix-turn-helix transcriptional regulator [Chitinophaga agrisoli]|uniref:Helix-turn-helix transcriptional regulator n=1 Tax=Chitinophaga agrisoli TaxID=2607653 RepID=A0A5B2VKX3_9BACT|nr:helix-turn-helix domain-containing protein [Chitinophaga agrisoli]KAA2238942.1 helix-turn-helix transcriptional regulator [Chitinophaga agrisoli]
MEHNEQPTTYPTPYECQNSLGAIRDALFVIGGKWKLQVISAIGQGHNRFNELQRALTGISARVLSAELKDLELNGFVTRKADPNSPVNVEYGLTDYVHTLYDVLRSLTEWGEMHGKKIRGKD